MDHTKNSETRAVNKKDSNTTHENESPLLASDDLCWSNGTMKASVEGEMPGFGFR
jgi:hypothetical protein